MRSRCAIATSATRCPSPIVRDGPWARVLATLTCVRCGDIGICAGLFVLGLASSGSLPTLVATEYLWALAAFTLTCAHAFLVNDVSDWELDQGDKQRHVFHRRDAAMTKSTLIRLAVLTAAAAIVLAVILAQPIVWILLGLMALSYLYSVPPFRYKGSPVLSPLMNFAAGCLYFLAGYVARGQDRPDGALLAMLFPGLLVLAAHLGQECRDIRSDAHQGLRTLAVVVGYRKALLLSFLALMAAHGIAWELASLGFLPQVLGLTVLMAPAQIYFFWRAMTSSGQYRDILRWRKINRFAYALLGVAYVSIELLAARAPHVGN